MLGVGEEGERHEKTVSLRFVTISVYPLGEIIDGANHGHDCKNTKDDNSDDVLCLQVPAVAVVACAPNLWVKAQVTYSFLTGRKG